MSKTSISFTINLAEPPTAAVYALANDVADIIALQVKERGLRKSAADYLIDVSIDGGRA